MYNNPQYSMPLYNAYNSYNSPQMQRPIAPQNQIPFSDVRYGTLDEAKAQLVMPSNSIMFINRNLGEVYIKSANHLGEPFLDIYVFKKKDENNPINTAPSINLEDFVKKEDIKDFVTKKDLENLKAQLNPQQKINNTEGV